MNNTVHVLDSIPGTRKTSGAINYINNNPTKPILYICEYISEIERVCSQTHSLQPQSTYDRRLEAYHSKKDDIKQLLLLGKTIASTHSLFITFDEEILSIINKLGYEIILDEVVDPICDVQSKYNGADYKTLDKSGHIITDRKTGQIQWNWSIEEESAYSELKDLCDTGQLYKAGTKNAFIHMLPTELFSSASKITVMTYNFRGSHLYQYLLAKGFNIVDETDIKSMDSTQLREHIKEHLVICSHPATDKKRSTNKSSYYTNGYTLSYTNYTHNMKNVAKSEEFKKFIGGRINQVARHICNNYESDVKLSDVMYTLPMTYSGVANIEKEVKGKLQRTKICNHTPKTIKVPVISGTKCFVPFNCRGTNEYSDKAVLIHCYNQFANPSIKSYYECYTNIEIDEEEIALNTLIQWIFRSRIRKYNKGEKVYVYCLSERMENILKNWLDSL